ncbi:hypothetical protein [Occultella glacieicola]|nr:hypothetical protein [Occultella glacieicola]
MSPRIEPKQQHTNDDDPAGQPPLGEVTNPYTVPHEDEPESS